MMNNGHIELKPFVSSHPSFTTFHQASENSEQPHTHSFAASSSSSLSLAHEGIKKQCRSSPTVFNAHDYTKTFPTVKYTNDEKNTCSRTRTNELHDQCKPKFLHCSRKENNDSQFSHLTSNASLILNHLSGRRPPRPTLYRHHHKSSGSQFSPISLVDKTMSKSDVNLARMRQGKKGNAHKVIHVVSGLRKGNSLPVPPKNRTMANGDFGDDAAFFVETSNNYVLGISDGAGGNRGYGFDPRNFSRQLMKHCADYILAHNRSSVKEQNKPFNTVFSALQKCQDRQIYGSGTACLCSFDKFDGILHTINIGDSGFMVLRDSQIYHFGKRNYRDDGSEAPLQLDVYPWSFNNRARFMVETNELGNINELREQVLICPGDVLIMASDGVFDSLSANAIMKIIYQSLADSKRVLGLSCLMPHEELGRNDATTKVCLAKAADSVVTIASQCKHTAPDDIIVVLALFS